MLFQRTEKVPTAVEVSSLKPDVQGRPYSLGKDGATGRIKVDYACRLGDLIVVAGWSTAAVELGLQASNRVLHVERHNVSRDDVASHFNLASGAELGFVLVADHADDEPIALCWHCAAQREVVSHALSLDTGLQLGSSDQAALVSALLDLCTSIEPFSTVWRSLVAQLPIKLEPSPEVRGFLEMASSSPTGQAVVVGWVLNLPGTTVWIEDELGRIYGLESAFRSFRQDLLDAFGQEFGHSIREGGLTLVINDLSPDAVLRLKGLTPRGLYHLGEVRCTRLSPDPLDAARWLFGIAVPPAEFPRRVPIIDEVILTPLIQQRKNLWDDLPVTAQSLGEPLRTPLVSIIVPLYGRTDFVEHQLIEFAEDAWLRDHAQIIYVLDDPRIVHSFASQIQALYRIYRQPLTWVWGGANRGFSGANNLGAEHAKGEYLLFLNSDVFPQQPGWLQSLIEVLQQRPDIGAVGPRLVFGHGAIQHAGMEYVRFEERGVWGNHHPYMGLDPSLDPHRELTIVSAVTGACLMLRRTDFEGIGGWDTGYLVGDFEDSDLCLKLRQRGLRNAYLPTVQLTHLERQSFKLLGQDDFRAQVATYNAVRHQLRWEHLIQSPNC